MLPASMASPVSAADGDRIAVAGVSVEGAAEGWDARLQERIGKGLQAGGLPATLLDASCRDRECAGQGVDGASHVAMTTIEVSGRDYTITLHLIDAASGETVSSLTESCDTCGFAELAETVEAVAARAGEALESVTDTPASLEIVSTPAGAMVSIDGEQVGTTPVQLALTPDPHEIVVEAAGHVAHRRRLDLASGQLASIDVQLAPEARAPEPAERDRGHKLALTLGSTSVAGGVVGLATGIALLAIHATPISGRCTSDVIDADGDCKFLHDTQVGGAVSTTLGAVLLVGGVTAIVVARPRRGETSKRRAQVEPLGLGARVSF